MIRIDGKKHAQELNKQLKSEIKRRKLQLQLAIIQIGDNDASNSYIKIKKEVAQEMNISCLHIKFGEKIAQEFVIEKIIELNNLDTVHGIILQLPIPSHFDYQEIVSTIDPRKDVDCLTPINRGLLYFDKARFIPPVAQAVFYLLDNHNINITSKNMVLVGYGELTNKAINVLAQKRKATTIICNDKTQNIEDLIKLGDIVISAVGKYNLINYRMLKKKVILIDLGFSKKNEIIYGDINNEKIEKKASFLVPNPNGVGPLTVTFLLRNLINTQ